MVQIVTDPMTARTLMRGQLAFFRQNGFEVYVISSPGADLDKVAQVEGVHTIPIAMQREICPIADLRALACLFRTLRSLDPQIVVASTPKASLLGLLAAWFARIPVRIFTLRGLRLETTRGVKRYLLYACERITVMCAHRVLSVSPSLRKRHVDLRLSRPRQITVLGPGSSNGVDVGRFSPGTEEDRREAFQSLGLSENVPIVGFVGRLTRDKGVEDLVDAFLSEVLRRFPEARLLLLGGFEEGDQLPERIVRSVLEHPRIVLKEFVTDPAEYYRVMHMVAFPSYREGFPNVPLEAAACGVPVVGYAATGTMDAINHDETGRLVPVGDRVGLAHALLDYLENPELAHRHGAAGRIRAITEFSSYRIWRLWSDCYLDQVRMNRTLGRRFRGHFAVGTRPGASDP